nr:hypothetical protein [Tanacetum cinerariifolium]
MPSSAHRRLMDGVVGGLEVTAKKRRQGGDQATCMVLGWLLGNVMEVLEMCQEDACEILRTHAKWDAPSPVEPINLTRGEHVPGVGHEELLGEDARPRHGPRQSPSRKKKPNPRPRRALREVTRQSIRGAYVNRISSQMGSRRVGVRGR